MPWEVLSGFLSFRTSWAPADGNTTRGWLNCLPSYWEEEFTKQTGNLAHPCLKPGKRLVSGKCSINICYTNRWMEWIVLNGIKSLTIINVFVEHPSDKLHSMWALGWHLRISQWSKKFTWGPLTASESRVTSLHVMGSSDSHKCHNSHREIEMIDVMSPGLPPHICEPQMAG